MSKTTKHPHSPFRDEQGTWSAARIFLLGWLTQTCAYVWVCLFRAVDASGAVLALDTTVATGLIAWAGGARIAQYIGPQIGAAGAAVASAAREAISKRRDPNAGIESTP